MTWCGPSLSPVSQGEEISVSRVFDAPREFVYRARRSRTVLPMVRACGLRYRTRRCKATPRQAVSSALCWSATRIRVAALRSTRPCARSSRTSCWWRTLISARERAPGGRAGSRCGWKSSTRRRQDQTRAAPGPFTRRDVRRPGGSLGHLVHQARLPVAALAVATAGYAGPFFVSERFLAGIRAVRRRRRRQVFFARC